MADKTPTLPPASEPFPGSRTPGWNDPPTLQYNPLTPTSSTGSRPRLNLNKRVAFPLQGMGGAPGVKPTAIVQPNQIGMPPPAIPLPPTAAPAANSNQPIAVVHPMSHVIAPPPPLQPRVPPTSSSPTEGSRDAALPDDIQESTFRWLRDQVAQVPESLNVRREDIERRLGFMEQLWRTGNLSAEVQQKVYQLAKAVADRSFREAIDTYTALAVNHSNDCAVWAIALRHIVLTVQPLGGASDSDGVVAMIVETGESVPAVFVPAMPRATNADDGTSTTTSYMHVDNNVQSAVQHI